MCPVHSSRLFYITIIKLFPKTFWTSLRKITYKSFMQTKTKILLRFMYFNAKCSYSPSIFHLGHIYNTTRKTTGLTTYKLRYYRCHNSNPSQNQSSTPLIHFVLYKHFAVDISRSALYIKEKHFYAHGRVQRSKALFRTTDFRFSYISRECLRELLLTSKDYYFIK